ncbi:MAG: molybdopterin-dependent oxidoreductase [Acidiferrobacterales bacterium]
MEAGDNTEDQTVRAVPARSDTLTDAFGDAITPRMLIRRHARATRIFHWVNFFTITVMLMSGLQIFNARPDLYWGISSRFHHPVVSLGARENSHGRLVGVTTIAGHTFDTTGFLGVSKGRNGLVERGFPRWATLPGTRWLAMGRRWHLFFAWVFVLNGFAYAAFSLFSGHLKRDLLPGWRELRHIGTVIIDHARLRFPKGEEARRYNVLQKLAYLLVIFGLGPLALLTGLTMSPTMDAGFPGLLWLFGGRQSARTIHFIVAFSFLGFFIVHIAMVLLSGLWNNLRSMITGRYAIRTDPAASRLEPGFPELPANGAGSSARRNFVLRVASGTGAFLFGGAGMLMLGNFDRLSRSRWFPRILGLEGNITERAQDVVVSGDALAPEFTRADIAPVFRANGTTDPDSATYHALAQNDFRDWNLRVDGLVTHPLRLSLDALQEMPARTQITRHDCVEGWSCIGEWTGVPLSHVLALAGPLPEARYVMFFCADPMDGNNVYYESLDLASATHPQTILAYRLNGQKLPMANGAPLRLRVERQLGYKSAKYLMHIQLVDNYRRFGGGHGGYWEDQGYPWYAGI